MADVQGVASTEYVVEMTGLPLDGIRVVDLSMGWAGPLATMTLGSMGAQIIKVESCQRMDWWRGRGYHSASRDDRRYEQLPTFNSTNLYKSGITLNLTDPQGIALLKQLVEISDVVIENYSARVMANFGLEYDTLRSWQPNVIMVSMPAFGKTGPWRDYTAFGQAVECLSGLTHLTGYAGGSPRLLSNGADPFVAINGAIATLMALMQRQRTGIGQYVEVAHIEAITPFIGVELLGYLMTGRVPPRQGNASDQMAPHGCYPAAGDDAWVVIAIDSDQEWVRFCAASGNHAWEGDPRFATSQSRIQHREELDLLLAEWTSGRDRYELMHMLQAAGVAAGPVLNNADLRVEPHLRATEFYHSINRKYVGTHEYPRVPIRLSTRSERESTPAPCLGEHNRWALGDLLGLTEMELDELTRQQVIGTEPVGG